MGHKGERDVKWQKTVEIIEEKQATANQAVESAIFANGPASLRVLLSLLLLVFHLIINSMLMAKFKKIQQELNNDSNNSKLVQRSAS